MSDLKCAGCGKLVTLGSKQCQSCGLGVPGQKSNIGSHWTVPLAGMMVIALATVLLRGNLSFTPRPADEPGSAANTAPSPTSQQQQKRNEIMASNGAKGRGVEILLEELLAVCRIAAPHFNGIVVQARKSGLYCVHDFYNRYSLSAGDTGKLIAAFTAEWQSELRYLRIDQVGVWGTGEHASGQWYTVN